MECDCIAYLANGIVYGIAASVLAWAIVYLLIDTVRERGEK